MEEIKIKEEIYVAVQFMFQKNVRTVSFGMINQMNHIMYAQTFQDNEFYSNFESFLIQTNPRNSEDQTYTLMICPPENTIEFDKIKDIVESSGLTFTQKKKNEFTRQDSIIQPLIRQQINHIKEIPLEPISFLVQHLQLQPNQDGSKDYTIQSYNHNDFMRLDQSALGSLQIYCDGFTSIYSLLNQCKTVIGSRCLKRYIQQPLQNIEEIDTRLNMVQDLLNNEQSLHQILEILKKIPDLEKLQQKLYKIHHNQGVNGELRDALKVYNLVQLVENLQDFQVCSEIIEALKEELTKFSKLKDLVEKWVDMAGVEKGEITIKPDHCEKLTQIKQSIQQNEQKIQKIRQEAENDLEIQVRLTESNTHHRLLSINKKKGDLTLRNYKDKYKSIKITKQDIDFTTTYFSQLVEKGQELSEQYKEQSNETIQKLLKAISTYQPVVELTGHLIAKLDVMCSFAIVSRKSQNEYVRPTLLESGGQIDIQGCRHPILEDQDISQVVANDCYMDRQDSKLHIITGPNMGGKSTFIRQNAITILLGHIGCFVPCTKASFPIIDAIITRVGASDLQLRGISTFMNEMLETTNLIASTTERSFVIIDELGRGTSTSDGFGLAYSIAQYLCEVKKCYCLFATHFHEMTSLENKVRGIKNYHCTAQFEDENLTMLYKVEKGKSLRSYGIQVLQLLKFPQSIIDDADRKANELESVQIQNQTQSQENYQKMEIEGEDLMQLGKIASLQQKRKINDLYQQYQKKDPNFQDNLENRQQFKNQLLTILKNH